jgi:hypothetical protein
MQLVRMTASTGEEDVEGDLIGKLMIIEEDPFRGEPCWVSWRRGCASGLILQNDVQRMNDTRNVTKNRQQDVDEEVGIAATLQEDTKRW